MKVEEIKTSLKATIKSFAQVLPIVLGVLMLLSLVLVLVPATIYGRVFTGGEILDPLVGAVLGSVAAGNPITSYIIGGELMDQGVGILAVTAFIVAWVTVGLVQLPAESMILGRRFALVRNGASFVSAVLIAILMAATLELVA